MKKRALFILANDGITSFYAGIGTFVKSYLDTISEKENIKNKYDLYLITTYRAPEFFGYCKKTSVSTKKLARKLNGDVISVEDGLEGLEGYGGPQNWDLASENAAKEINRIAKKYCKNYVIAIDTSFMKVADSLDFTNITVLSISPQSLESIHKTGIPGRFEWEKQCLKGIAENKKVVVSFSSEYLREELINSYSVSEDKLVESLSGINLNSERYDEIDELTIIKELKQYNIPIDRKIVFTLGRLEPYKGFDEVVKFYDLMRKNGEDPFLIILSLAYTADDPLIKKMKELYKRYNVDGILYTEKDMHLPLLLWQWKNCEYSMHLSKFEPFGMAPVEARYLAGKNEGPIVITSCEGGLNEQCINGLNGISVEYGNLQGYSDMIKSLQGMNRKQMRIESRNHMIEKYDAKKNILKYFNLLGIK
ncbi:glycosyltransferase [Candidatus Dojkabacteria bacterium]|jgi:glycosyltransferase involved in cell wall biosynthesis|nr:glycosyltransferase [Candidatus Dojkabacteria bacterium]